MFLQIPMYLVYRFVHAALMVLLLAGLYLCWAYPWYTVPHLACVLWMTNFHWKYGYCILTKLEKQALAKQGRKVYTGGFYQYYLFRRVLEIKVSTRFATNFLIFTKVIPGMVPAIYPFIWAIF